MTAHPIVIAHRGASGYRPEHTGAAYELAFRLGADAVEPDIIPTKDGVLVIRHENEISQTTDVALHPEFADRRITKIIDGVRLTGWFTEDFTWAELSTLRAVERLPKLRPANATFDGEQPILRLADLLGLLDGADRTIGMVAEIKHASYFESIGLPLDQLFADELVAAGWADDARLTVESFEQTVLGAIRARGIGGRFVFLVEASGAPADQVALHGTEAKLYADYLTDAGLAELAASGDGMDGGARGVDGISVDKKLLLTAAAGPPAAAPSGEVAVGASGAIGSAALALDIPAGLVPRAHAAGLTVFCWTLRAENQFLAEAVQIGNSPGDYGDWMAEFQQLMRSGLDGVFADQPDLAIAARASL